MQSGVQRDLSISGLEELVFCTWVALLFKVLFKTEAGPCSLQRCTSAEQTVVENRRGDKGGKVNGRRG